MVIKMKNLERISLNDAGINAGGILEFLKEVDKNKYQIHSLMITRHGKAAFSCNYKPYTSESEHHLHSFTKGIIALAVGILVDEGRMSTDDLVLSYFPEYNLDNVSENMKKMKIHHLMTMTSGEEAAHERHGCSDIIRTFLTDPVKYEPGSRFHYNSEDTNMVGAIIKKVTGLNPSEFIKIRLFKPMKIELQRCDTVPSGLDQSGGGLYLNIEDMAKITVLVLQKGVWEGKRLVSEEWINRMTAVQYADSIDFTNPEAKDWRSGYGYYLWRCSIPNAYRFDGTCGQYGIILEDYDASIVMTCGEMFTEPVMKLMWKYLLPALSGNGSASDQKELEEYASHLCTDWKTEHEIVDQEAKDMLSRISGKEIIFPQNEATLLSSERTNLCYTSKWTENHRTGIQSISFRLENGKCFLKYKDNDVCGELPVGMNGDFPIGILHSLWGEYEFWTTVRCISCSEIELRMGTVHGEPYSIFNLEFDGTNANVKVEYGPWDKRKPLNKLEFCCKIQ